MKNIPVSISNSLDSEMALLHFDLHFIISILSIYFHVSQMSLEMNSYSSCLSLLMVDVILTVARYNLSECGCGDLYVSFSQDSLI